MSKSDPPHARHSAKDLGRRVARRVMTCGLAVALFLVSAAGFAWHDLQSRINTVYTKDLVSNNLPDSYEGRAVNLLILGSDTRAGDNNVDNSEGSEDVAVARSDTAMIMHISADRQRIDVVSIPRDTVVDIPSCKRLDGTESEAESSGQFNAAFANGAGSGTDTNAVASGAACAQKTVQEMTDIPIDDFMVVDFNGLSKMVNALGGVKVYVDEEISDPEYTGLELPVGCHSFDGPTALQYSRVRHGVGDGSDISRISRQQNLMGAMARTVQASGLLGADKAYSFAGSALEALTVSQGLSLDKMAGLGSSVQKVGMENINFVTMPTAAASWDANRVVPTEDADEVWTALRKDKPVSTESVTTSADASDSPAPDTSGEDAEGTQDPGGNPAEGADPQEGDQPPPGEGGGVDPAAQKQAKAEAEASQSAQAAAAASAAAQCK